ncbi:MAG: DUF4245 domain-containing protein [Nocardioidaceae bacterium]
MSGQAGQTARHQQSPLGMVGAMIVLAVLLLAWLGFRSLTSNDPASAVRTVDYAQVVTPARTAADFGLLAPASLPTGWRATSAGFTNTVPQHWHLGVLTDQDRYIGLEQGPATVSSFVEKYVDEKASRTGSVEVAGRRWTTYTDSGGDLALVRSDGGAATLVVGHDVSRSTLEGYVAGLR